MEKFVVLLRHGIAHPRGSEPEETRSLTGKGHKRMKAIARALQLIFPKAEAMVSSPLLRCVQTADWVHEGYGRELSLTTSDALRPDMSMQAVRALIDEHSARRLILVGHEPSLTKAMLHLTKLRGGSGMELKKGGCYGLRSDETGVATLEWMLPEIVMRAMR